MTKLLGLLFLVTIALSNNISISFISGTATNSDNAHSFELISIDQYFLLTKHDPTLMTHKDLLTLRHQRGLLSSARVSQRLFTGSGTYFMRLGVGTPPNDVYMSIDTGSDIVWLQCSTCKKCYKQSDPIFDPRNSTTFSRVGCGDPPCKQLHAVFNGGCRRNTCLYNATYNSGSFSQGEFSTETLTLGGGGKTKKKTRLKNIALGCGHDNRGWDFTKTAGVLGLGRGNLSFITQTSNQFHGQFSYCLTFWFTNSSKSSIVFGPSELTRKAVYTPLIYTNVPPSTYYYVNLTGISVNGTRVSGIKPSISDVKPNGNGGVILDSGTDYTRLVKPAYKALRKAFRAAFQKQKSTVGSPLKYLWFDTCYNISRKLSDRVEIPTVELHFDKGANMTLGPDNTVILMDTDGKVDTVCFAFMPNGWYTTIGSFQQQGFRIVYDLPCGRVGFVPEAC